MAAYAALVSVMQIIHQLEHHPRPPISLDKVQTESLTKNVMFLQEFLEGYTPTGKYEEDGVESQIRDVAHAAEDVIESHIVDCIEAGSTSHADEVEFGQRLQKVIEDMDLINKEAMEPKENLGVKRWSSTSSSSLRKQTVQRNSTSSSTEKKQNTTIVDRTEKKEVMETKEKMAVQQKGFTSSSRRQKQTLQRNSTSSSSRQKQTLQWNSTSSSSRQKQTLQWNSTSSSTKKKQNTTMVGFDDVLHQLLDKLTSEELERQIIPIVGMGGMGKTTLARNVYEHPLIKGHFDIHAWATISQQYDAGNILTEILSQSKKDKGSSSEADIKQLGEYLHKYLFGRRYLIVMDDMWSIEAWEKIQIFFPGNRDGSRVIVTTRLSNLARELSNSYSLRMRFLDTDESWDLFSGIVFHGDDYPSEMVEIGKKIVENCRGLPLSIVVVGGMLAKSEYKIEYWKYIKKNLSSFVNSGNDEHCLKILQLSYNQLPVHLKPCFLYMGVFKEDWLTYISYLVMLWVAEGFLKPKCGKDLEEVAKEYVNDLIDRNLVFIVKYKGTCVKIHDLLRDLCLRQAKLEKFYNIITRHTKDIPDNQRRIIVPKGTFEEDVTHDVLNSMLNRSLICHGSQISIPCHRLLRIFEAEEPLMIDKDCYFLEVMLRLFNLRFLYAENITCHSKLNSSFHLLWSLQTLHLEFGDGDGFREPLDIWNMPQLRKVAVRKYMSLPDPPVCNGQDDIVLKNLQKLWVVRNFKCSEEVIKRIPNVKVLNLVYNDDEEESCLNNLDRLHKLKKFYCNSVLCRDRDGSDFMLKLTFPRSLKKLYLNSNHLHWEDMLEKIGSLPLLRSLSLRGGVFTTHVWETVEGQFPNLKLLDLSGMAGLEYWNSESSHFPRLEHLVLCDIEELKEIPLGIGEIPTLQSIKLQFCSDSVVISCKTMQEEQEELNGEEVFKVSVQLHYREYLACHHLASPIFRINE